MKNSKVVLIIFTLILLSCNKNKAKRVDVFLFNSNLYNSKNENQKIVFLDSILASNEDTSNDKKTRTFLFNLSAEYYYLNDLKESLKISRKIFEMAKKHNDSMDMAKAYYYIGDCYETEKRDSAFYYYQKAENLYFKLKNQENEAKMLFNKSYILFYEGSYLESEVMIAKAYKMLKNSNNFELLYSISNLMGCNFEKLEDYDNALKYFNVSKNYLKLLEKKEDNKDKINSYHIASAVNIANVYEKKQDYKKSIEELQLILTDDLKAKSPSNYATVVGNLGYCKMKMGDLKASKDLIQESLDISLKTNNKADVIFKLNNLGEYYLITKDTLKSIEYLKKSLSLAQSINSGDQIKIILKLLSKADFKRDAFYKEKYIRMSDSLNIAQKKITDKYARIELETSQLEDEKKILIRKNTIIIITSLLAVLLLLLLLFARYLKGKKDHLNYLFNQQKANEEMFGLIKNYEGQLIQIKKEEQKRISRELHDGVMNKIYGVRLQLGFLNEKDNLEAKIKRSHYIDVLQEIEKEIRVISHDLSNDIIYKDFDFNEVFLKMINQQNEITSTLFEIEIDYKISWVDVSEIKKINLYKILQELVLNVSKHSQAQNCKVDIFLNENNKIQLSVIDNGVGFDKTTDFYKGIGLQNIKKRVFLINGVLKIDTIKTRTKIDVIVNK